MATQLLPASRVTQVMAVERLLLQLDETAGNFDAFWTSHRHRLEQCLQLRQFEEQFKQLQVVTNEHLRHLVAMETDEPDSAAEVDDMLADLNQFQHQSAADMERAGQLRLSGESLIGCGQYAVDCVQPKCAELERICTEFTARFNYRRSRLHQAHLIWRAILHVKCWCDEAEQLFRGQQRSKVPSTKDLVELLDKLDYCDVELLRNNLDRYNHSATTNTALAAREAIDRFSRLHSQCSRLTSTNHNSYNVHETTRCHDDGSRDVVTAAYDKQTCVVEEIINTENIYVDELRSIVEGYESQLDSDDMKSFVTQRLRDRKYTMFANLEDIYNFHSRVLLEELTGHSQEPSCLAQCFLKHRDQFEGLYSEYCQNMNDSQQLLQELGDDDEFLRECQRRLEHKLPLRAYLLKPVQRITKYKLLLKELLQYCSSDQPVSRDVTMALSSMTSVVRHINDVMHHSTITAFSGDTKQLGSLLLQAPFSVWLQNGYNRMRFKLSPSCRHLFLYEQAIMFCKLKQQLNSTVAYVFKTLIKISDICLTEEVKGDDRKFELCTRDRSQAYVLQAATTELKDEWITQLSELLRQQTTRRLHSSQSYDEHEFSLSASLTTDSQQCCNSRPHTNCTVRGSDNRACVAASTAAVCPLSVDVEQYNVVLPSALNADSSQVLDEHELELTANHH